MRTWIDPGLAEDAVFARMRALAARDPETAGCWDREREALYSRPKGERDEAFLVLAKAWFERLDLARPLHRALARTPSVRAGVSEVRLHRALRHAQEGSELFRDGRRSRLALGITPARLADPAEAEPFFVRECLYAEDMLDPAVEFAPELGLEAGEHARAELVRDRLRVLWEARVAGRTARMLGTVCPTSPSSAFRRAFAAALSSAEVDALHSRVSVGELATFPQLLDVARG